MIQDRDILKDPAMKENPFVAPEGYFESLGERMVAATRREEAPAPLRRLAPYLAYAAALAFLVVAGTFLLRTFTPLSVDTTVESLAYADIYPMTEPDALYYCSAEDPVSDDDVVEYLIYTGTSLEEISSTNE